MSLNYQRLCHIISKWPVEKHRKELDFGLYLRDLLKKSDAFGNVFPGDSAENSRILDSLLRILSNEYKNKYPCSSKKGGSGLESAAVDALLREEKLRKKEKIFKWSR